MSLNLGTKKLLKNQLVACDCAPAASHAVSLLNSVSLDCLRPAASPPDKPRPTWLCPDASLAVSLEKYTVSNLLQELHLWDTLAQSRIHLTLLDLLIPLPSFPGIYLELACLTTYDLIHVNNHVITCHQPCLFFFLVPGIKLTALQLPGRQAKLLALQPCISYLQTVFKLNSKLTNLW